jgi:hypothetical protein
VDRTILQFFIGSSPILLGRVRKKRAFDLITVPEHRMKRDSVVTCLLLVNACLLVYVAVLVWQKPSLFDIDERIDYWHKFYQVERMRGATSESQDETEVPTTGESSATEFLQTPDRDEGATAPDPSSDSSTTKPPGADAR